MWGKDGRGKGWVRNGKRKRAGKREVPLLKVPKGRNRNNGLEDRNNEKGEVWKETKQRIDWKQGVKL